MQNLTMHELLNLLKEFETNNSNKFKESFLLKHFEELKDILSVVYNKRIKFNITPDGLSSRISLDSLLNKSTGNSHENFNVTSALIEILTFFYDGRIQEAVDKIAEYNDYHLLEIVKKCLDRKLLEGISYKTLQKVEKALYKENKFFVNEAPYMRCSTEMDKIKYPCIVQEKYDGTFVNIFMDKNKNIRILSRQGVDYELDENDNMSLMFKHVFKNFDLDENVVLLGEIVCMDKLNNYETPLDRQTSNGMINRFIKRHEKIETINKSKKADEKKLEEISAIHEDINEIQLSMNFYLWDMIDTTLFLNSKEMQDEIPEYRERMKRLAKLIAATCFTLSYNKRDQIFKAQTTLADDYGDVMKRYNEIREEGGEGVVVKNLHLKFKDGTSKDQVKLKNESECELLVTGWEPGKGSLAEGIGSLICVSKCGKLKVNVSTGMTLEDAGVETYKGENNGILKYRAIDGFDKNRYNGKIISVKYNDVILSKNSEVYALSLPVFMGVRDDKSEADTLEYIQSAVVRT